MLPALARRGLCASGAPVMPRPPGLLQIAMARSPAAMIATLGGRGLCHDRDARWPRPMPCPRVSLVDACAMVGGFSAAQAYAMIATLVGRGLRPCSGKCFPLWHGVAWVRPLVASEHAFGIVFGKKCVRQVVFGKCCVWRVLRLRSLA